MFCPGLWVSSLIMAAENCPSPVIDAILSFGIIQRNIDAQEVLPESLGPTITSFRILCGILPANKHW